MTRYTGNHCPVCEQAFTDEDDIVVCPDCGTPYHRACWQKVGACMHKSEHAAGFEWQPEFGPEAEKAAHEATCPNCGTHNQPGAAQCSHCGCPLPKDDGPRPDPKDEDAQVPIYARDPSTVHKPDNSRTTPGPRIDTYTDDDNGGICRREIGPEDTIDGIKAKDWAAYVGRSPMYYLMQFFRMSMTKQKGHSLPFGIPVRACLSALPQDVEGGAADSPAVHRFECAVAHRHCGDLQPVAVRQYAAALGARGRRRLCHCGLDRQDFAGAFLGLAVPQHLKEKY